MSTGFIGFESKAEFVGIGEIKLITNADKKLRVLALGSCVAVIFYSLKARAAAIAHVALPDSSTSNGAKDFRPGYYADLAILSLIAEFKKLGITRNSEITIKLVGGASVMDKANFFDIGNRNVIAIRRMLWRCNMGALSEDIGKDYSRTVTFDIETGKVLISSPGRGEWEI